MRRKGVGGWAGRGALALALAGVGAAGLLAFSPAGCAARRPAGADATRRSQDLREGVALGKQAEQAQREGEHERCVELSRRALALAPDLGGVWNNLGVSLMHTGQYLPAVEALRRAADLLPTDPTPYENLGHLYADRGFADDALRYFTLSLERDPYWLSSLRGAAAAGQDLLHADADALDRVKRGLLVERDPAWRKVFEAERVRLEQALADKNKSLRTGL